MTPSPHRRSTRLEHFSWEAGAPRIEAEGKHIDLSSPERQAALEACQAFYEEALHAYGAGTPIEEVDGADNERRGRGAAWLDRLRPSQWVGAARSLFVQILSRLTGLPIPAGAAKPGTSTPPAPPKPSPEPPPPAMALRAAFADERGVHVIWSHSGGKGTKPRETELLYSFDSAVAEKLQNCYAGLAAAGVEVVDLSVWRKTPAPEASPSSTPIPPHPSAGHRGSPQPPPLNAPSSAQGSLARPASRRALLTQSTPASPGSTDRSSLDAPASQPSPAEPGPAKSASPNRSSAQSLPRASRAGARGAEHEAGNTAATANRAAPASPVQVGAGQGNANAPGRADGAVTMRLHPGPADQPGRALVSPVGDDRSLQILSAPERLVAALHAAADPARPVDQRLTHLRCVSSRGALKVVAIGTGQHESEPGQPARWENVAPWFEAAKQQAEATAPRPRVPEPELF